MLCRSPLSFSVEDNSSEKRRVVMRKCLRCGSKMTDGNMLRTGGTGWTFYLTDKIGIDSKNLGALKAAVCPQCREVSFYLSGGEAEHENM